MSKIKFRTWLDFDCHKFISNSGNGKNVAKYYLDNSDGILKKQLNKDGQQVYFSLYDNIQLNSKTNDYKTFLNAGGSYGVAEIEKDTFTDVSNLGDIENLTDAKNSMSIRNMSLEDLKKNFDGLIKKYGAEKYRQFFYKRFNEAKNLDVKKSGEKKEKDEVKK